MNANNLSKLISLMLTLILCVSAMTACTVEPAPNTPPEENVTDPNEVKYTDALALLEKGDYDGAFSLFMQYHTEPEVLFDVPPDCFLPAPKVTSAVLRCRVRKTPAVNPACGEEFFFRTVRAAFAQRRKTLLNSLSSVFGGQLSKDAIAAVIAECGFEATVRGERLGLAEFAALADALHGALHQ